MRGAMPFMLTSHAPTAALALELIGLAYGAGLLWLGASLRADATTLDRWRQPSLVLSSALTALGLWWPGHLHLESYGAASYVALIAAVLLPLCAVAFARDAFAPRTSRVRMVRVVRVVRAASSQRRPPRSQPR